MGRVTAGICAVSAVVLLVVAEGSGATAANSAGQPLGTQWTMTGLPQRGIAAGPVALNDHGLIVGEITVDDPSHPSTNGNDCCWRAVKWEHGRLAQLDMLSGPQSQATAVNERGQIVGWSETRRGSVHALLWQNGRTIDLGPGVAVDISENGIVVGVNGDRGFVWERGITTELPFNPKAVNERGEVVGFVTVNAPRAWPGDYKARPYYWRSGRTRLLPTLPGFGSTSAEAINARGEIAGVTMTKIGDQHLVLWRGGRMHDLGVIGRGRGIGHISSVDVGQVLLNRSGEVAVSTDDVSGSQASATGAFILERGKLRRLPAKLRQVHGLNDRGQVVGVGAGLRSGLVWAAGRLTALPGRPSSASAINRSGEIVGTAGNRAVLWRPTPSSS